MLYGWNQDHVFLNFLHVGTDCFFMFFHLGTVVWRVKSYNFWFGTRIASVDVRVFSSLAYPAEVLCDGEEIVDDDTPFLI